jgi:hypothetical protein
LSFNISPIILSVNNSLRDLIASHLEIAQNDIHFESPGELDPLPDQGLSLFLYKISENPFLKNDDFIQENHGNPEILKKPPLPLDLYYLVTPYGNGTTKLINIEKILQLFYEQPILREGVLPRDLVDRGNKEIKIVLNDLTIEQVNHIWSMFPNKPFILSISYIVTPILLETLHGIETYRVLSKDTASYKVKK